MGVQDFFKCFEPKETISIKDMKGKIIAIDAMGEIYRAVTGMKNIHTLTDENGNITAHINTILSNIIEYRKNGIVQIWIFDNNGDKGYKKLELDKREDKRQKANTELENVTSKINSLKLSFQQPPRPLIDQRPLVDQRPLTPQEIVYSKPPVLVASLPYTSEEISINVNDISDLAVQIPNSIDNEEESLTNLTDKSNSLEKQAFKVTPEMIYDIQHLLSLLCIPFIEAPEGYEAEHLASQLCRKEYVSGIISVDADPIPFGSPILYKRDKSDQGKKKRLFHVYETNDILYQIHKKTGIPKENIDMVDLRKICICLGNDFNERIPKCGPITVFKKYSSINLDEKQISSYKKFSSTIPKSSYQLFLQIISKYEENVINNTDLEETAIKNAISWLVQEKNFSRDRLNRVFDPLLSLCE